MATHTPGPWKAEKVLNGNMIVGKVDNSESIAEVWIDKERQRADAALIAAAPELLEALRHVRHYEREWFRARRDGDDDRLLKVNELWAIANDAADAAIAKAEGGS